MSHKCISTQNCKGKVEILSNNFWSSNGYCNYVNALCNICFGTHWLVEFENEFLVIQRDLNGFFYNDAVENFISKRNQQ